MPRACWFVLLNALFLSVATVTAADPIKMTPTPAQTKSPTQATEPAKVMVTSPVTVGASPPVDPNALALTPGAIPAGPTVPINITKYGLSLFLVMGNSTEKTMLIGYIPTGAAMDFTRKFTGNLGWSQAAKSPTFVFTGRLTTEDEPGLFKEGASPIINDVPAFGYSDKKRLVLVIDTATELTRLNKPQSPPEGQIAVEGQPASAVAHLKLAGAESLALRNGPVPVAVPSRKPDAVPGAALVRATGLLAVESGVVRLQDATVKAATKK